MIVSTMNDLPGFEVTEVIGEVFGLTVRSRHIGSQVGAGLKSMVGGELKGQTKTLVDSRLQAQQRLVDEAASRAPMPFWPCATTPPRSAAAGRRSAPTALQ